MSKIIVQPWTYRENLKWNIFADKISNLMKLLLRNSKIWNLFPGTMKQRSRNRRRWSRVPTRKMTIRRRRNEGPSFHCSKTSPRKRKWRSNGVMGKTRVRAMERAIRRLDFLFIFLIFWKNIRIEKVVQVSIVSLSSLNLNFVRKFFKRCAKW